MNGDLEHLLRIIRILLSLMLKYFRQFLYIVSSYAVSTGSLNKHTPHTADETANDIIQRHSWKLGNFVDLNWLDILLKKNLWSIWRKEKNYQESTHYRYQVQKMRPCIKVRRGHRDACVGTWDLGTRDEVLEDIKYGTRGRVGRGRGYVWDGETEDAGCE